MELSALFHNKILLSAALAWVAAQIIKAGLNAVRHHIFEWQRIFGDGGMPSSHSATASAAALACGLCAGFDSALFGLSVVLAFTVCHDAMHSRQEIGKQAEVLNELIRDEKRERDLEELVGHTPTQVAVGIAVGLLSALLICL